MSQLASTGSSQTHPARSVRPPLVIAGVLLAIAIVVPLLVPTYARETPVLWGFPFFYWYQLLWVFICAALVSTAHRVLLADERRRKAARDARRGDGGVR